MRLSRFALLGAFAIASIGFLATAGPAAASVETIPSPFASAVAGPKSILAHALGADMKKFGLEGSGGISGQVLGIHEGWLVPPIARNFSDEEHGAPKPVEPVNLRRPIFPWAPEVATAPPSLSEGSGGLTTKPVGC